MHEVAMVADVDIAYLSPPYTDENNAALRQWFDF
jgi:hypothetical protein